MSTCGIRGKSFRVFNPFPSLFQQPASEALRFCLVRNQISIDQRQTPRRFVLAKPWEPTPPPLT